MQNFVNELLHSIDSQENLSDQAATSDIVQYSFNLGRKILEERSEAQRKQFGQFLTPSAVARYMVQELTSFSDECSILEPAIGSAVLACALIERIVQLGYPKRIRIDGYEVDPDLCTAAHAALQVARRYAAASGINVQFHIYHTDFVLAHTPTLQPSLFPDNGFDTVATQYHLVIANPPYFKLNHQDPRTQAASGQIAGHTNIYTLFMALSVKLLADQGQACFIVPRSFCSGAYFAKFRRDFITQALPLHVHLFESRQETFAEDEILQENLILTFQKTPLATTDWSPIGISTSYGQPNRQNGTIERQIAVTEFLGKRHGTLYFRLPVTELDQQILDIVDQWPGSFAQYGLQVSTGPVVPFRAQDFLCNTELIDTNDAVPLLWMSHVVAQKVTWPLKNNKPQAITKAAAIQGLLIPQANYVLTRRFSAKEEQRRLIAAPLLHSTLNFAQIGLENHLNYIHREPTTLADVEAIGLSALLNSALIDRYFRISNGNTQVNATELRSLPLPGWDIVKQIGCKLLVANETSLDDLVFTVLRETGYLPIDFPTFYETRFSMGKIQEAQDILKTLGLPKAQQTEMAALTLLVLAQLSEDNVWSQANSDNLRIHDILGQIQTRYDRRYAENTRETIRRQVIHQFIQAGLVVRNTHDPTLPTNSPNTRYALSESALQTLQTYRSESWIDAARAFLENQRSLIETYSKPRDQYKVPLMMESGIEYHLSPGLHNKLQVAIIEEFGPRFAPGAQVLYVGDTANKSLHINTAIFEQLGLKLSNHDKLPDVVLYDEQKNWLYLIEAVISHGPISPKRQIELQELLSQCTADLIFITAFPDFNSFKNFILDIAWETEVWVADHPDHMIHYNGDRFAGPRSKRG